MRFGKVPLTAHFPKPTDPVEAEQLYDLDLMYCADCTLVQLRDVPPAAVIFDENYPYFSSISKTLVAASREFAEAMISERGLSRNSLVVEIASNDGYLLQSFIRMDVQALGIEPTPKAATQARGRGVETVQAFFSDDLAKELVEQRGKADLVIANNVLAHVPDPNGFVSGIKHLLKPDGIASLDVGYLIDLIDKLAFDTIYHEHHCYFSLSALIPLFARHGLEIFDCQRIAAQGGSLRILVRHCGVVNEPPSDAVPVRLEHESELGVGNGRLLSDFSSRVIALASELSRKLRELKASGATVAAYGAAAKGVMLLNAAGLGREVVDYVVDRNSEKQGRLMPGSRIPIVSTDVLSGRPPDYLIILPWNIADEIMAQQAEFATAGGRFIVPLPRFQIISSADRAGKVSG